jgi:hypothetical protein
MRELDLQTRILNEIRDAGGWGRKWASPLQAGVPDLIVHHYTFGTMFIEVKLVIAKNFGSPKIATTVLQKAEMTKIKAAGGRAMVLCGIETPTRGRLYACHSDAILVHGWEPQREWKRTKITLDVVGLINEYYVTRS